MSTTRLAVLGCGSIGRRHLRNLRKLGQKDLLAFDPSAPAREAVESEFAIKCFSRLDDVWAEKPDTVLVTAPSSMHVDLAIAGARNNCHLFIEKPLSHTQDGVDDLLKLVRRWSLITMVGCNMRFHPGPALVKRLIDDGAVGNVLSARVQTGSYLPGWRPGTDYRESYSASVALGGGALLDCIHEIDLALWYLGPGRVAGAAIQKADSLGLEVDGLAEVLIQHDQGALTSIHLNFVQRDYKRCCQVIGEKGTVYWDFAEPVVEVRTSEPAARRYDLDPSWTIDRMYLDEMSYFLDCVRETRQTFSSVEDGRAALQVVLSAKKLGASIGSTA
jgi:predicted dehydrogenase